MYAVRESRPCALVSSMIAVATSVFAKILADRIFVVNYTVTR